MDSEKIFIETKKRNELIDITDKIQELITKKNIE